MTTRSFEITGEEELDALIPVLFEFGKNRKIWGFYGEMGAGKTTFIKHICRHLGVVENATSPTFSLINEYSTTSGFVYHFDFYRLEKQEEAIEIGCEEYFKSGHLCLIEWPEKILNLLPHQHVKITIIPQKDKRLITFSYD
jgi:tRNA threonylcarbamoyladenosine biosynthesis protein TsaE